MREFDEIVERVLANDRSLREVVLDDRTQIAGHKHESESLWDALADNHYVESLSLRRCNINDEELSSLSLALMDNKSITHLWLGYNHITSEGVECE
jgi:hypothetical protein